MARYICGEPEELWIKISRLEDNNVHKDTAMLLYKCKIVNKFYALIKFRD